MSLLRQVLLKLNNFLLSKFFAMITELRELGRNGLAKQRWRILLDNVDFTTQLKLSEYAKKSAMV